tara:strand:- start:9985 stop:10317 length:333 start_codon:yes stop_codon:yes gene_type:complete
MGSNPNALLISATDTGMIGCTLATSVAPLRSFATNTKRYAHPIATPMGIDHRTRGPKGTRPPSRRAEYAKNGNPSANRNAQNAVGGTLESARLLKTCIEAQIICAAHSAA